MGAVGGGEEEGEDEAEEEEAEDMSRSALARATGLGRRVGWEK